MVGERKYPHHIEAVLRLLLSIWSMAPGKKLNPHHPLRDLRTHTNLLLKFLVEPVNGTIADQLDNETIHCVSGIAKYSYLILLLLFLLLLPSDIYNLCKSKNRFFDEGVKNNVYGSIGTFASLVALFQRMDEGVDEE